MKRRIFIVLSLIAAFVLIQPISALHPLAAAHATSVFSSDGMPYGAFDQLTSTKLEIVGGTVEIAFAPGELSVTRAEVVRWVTDSAQAMTQYFERLPVRRVRVLIVPTAGKRNVKGTTYGYGGAAIKIALGQFTTVADLKRDWVMTHEMVHLTFPSMPDAQNWMQEGIATYVEPIARAQAGQLSAEKVWGDLVAGLPHGLPKKGDRGLDHTPTWGRTYWGGALFCLLADIEIRQRTQNRKGLQDALRAIAAAGGNIETKFSLAHALKIGDLATGVPVLAERYAQMKATPIETNLHALWQSLGVEVRGDTIIFHDDAPLADVRRAIVKG